MGIFEHLRRAESLTAEAAWEEGTFITGERYICSSVSLPSALLCGSRFARSEAGVAAYRQEGSYPPSLASWPKAPTSLIFMEAGFAATCALGFHENADKKLEILLLVRMLGHSEIIWRDVTVSVIQTRL